MRSTSSHSNATRKHTRPRGFTGPTSDYHLAIRMARVRQGQVGKTRGPGKCRRLPIFAIVRRGAQEYLVYSGHAYAVRLALLRKHGHDPALLGVPVAYVLSNGALYEL